MNLESILPGHCHALARRLLVEARAIRDELGRPSDARPVPEVTGAEPREVYFEASVAWRKAQRLATEVGADTTRLAPPAPGLQGLKPGHVYRLLESVLAQIDDVKARLGITEKTTTETADETRQPSDVLVTLVQVNRELSRSLERPFTPADVYSTVALASSYAHRLGATGEPAPFERRRQPADCYKQLESCLARSAALIIKRGGKALVTRGTPPDVLPGDVYDLANLVLGELAFLHASTPGAAPLHPFEPTAAGHRLPSHVYQLARTLDAQLASLS
jgi:hypothetical protein